MQPINVQAVPRYFGAFFKKITVTYLSIQKIILSLSLNP